MNTTNRIADLSILWKQAANIFPYFDRLALDWDGAYRAYLPKVLEAKTDRDFHLLLAEFMNLLGDGHTDYLFPKKLLDETGYLPFLLRYIQDTYCIDETAPEYTKYLGAELLSINDIPFVELIEAVKRYSYHVGDYVSRYRLHQILPFFLCPQSNTAKTTAGAFSFELCQAKPELTAQQQLCLTEPFHPLQIGKLDLRLYDKSILYIRLDNFLYAHAADEIRGAIADVPAISGIIFDLRENIGGMTMHGAKIAELLIPGVFHGCQKRTRSMTGIALSSASQIVRWSEDAINKHIAAGHTTQEEFDESRGLLANAHYDHYTDTYGTIDRTALYNGPCVILTSRHTVSAAEDFIAMFRSNHRATVIGTPTCGTTGTPFLQELTCGGRMRICSVGYKLLDGTEFIRCGIQPDVFCEISTEEFSRGYDAVLRKGLDHLRERRNQQ